MEHRTFTKENRSNLIEANKAFIYSTTEYFCNKSLDWSKDNELSVALIAFNRACESQSEIHTNFLGYAYALINSALIRYYIKLEESISFTFELENKKYLEYFCIKKLKVLFFIICYKSYKQKNKTRVVIYFFKIKYRIYFCL